MSKIRIYSLARELKLDNNQVLELARNLGADVSTASSAIDDVIADKIRAKKTEPKARQRGGSPRQPAQQRSQPATKQTAPVYPTAEVPKPEEAAIEEPPAKAATAAPPASPRRPAHSAKTSVLAPTAAPEPAAAATTGRHAKRYYLVDGLNVCNWQKTPSLAPLVTLLIELKRQGHSFLCIFDANTRFVLEDLGERDKYEHLLNRFDCIGEVPGGTQADDFILFRAHKTGDAIISNDQYRDQKYRERYKWLRSVSPRLCKGIVLGGFLILPELDVHARVRESLPSIIKEFEEVFSSPAHRERPEHRQESRSSQRGEPRTDQRADQRADARVEPRIESRADQKQAEPKPKAEPRHEAKPAPKSAESVPSPEDSATQGEGPVADLAAEPRPRSRRGRRRRGRRGGGGSGAANTGSVEGAGGAGAPQ
ncbi:MAG: translation initiation factor IF-2 N-terminal domain-containing protein [Acidobacteriota bacterium]